MKVQQSAYSGEDEAAPSPFVRGLSSGSAAIGHASVAAKPKANTDEIQDALDYVLNTMRRPTTSEAGDGTARHRSSPSPMIPGDSGKPGSRALSEGNVLTANTDLPPGLLQNGEGRGQLPDEHEDNTLGKSPLALRVLASTLIDLRAALEGENPHGRVMALLKADRPEGDRIAKRYPSLLRLTERKWEGIIEDVCDSAGEACEVLGDPRFDAAVAIFIKQGLHKLKADEFAERVERGSRDKTDAFGSLKPEPSLWSILAAVFGSILSFILLRLVTLFLSLYLAKRKRDRQEEERGRRRLQSCLEEKEKSKATRSRPK
jgi:hypothetical protein